LHVDWVGWSVRVVLGLLWFESLLKLLNHGQRIATASLLVFGLMVAAVETWARPFQWWRQRRVEPWPITQAHVESWNVSPVGGGEEGYYRGEVPYSYSVEGKTVLVNYDPGNHEVSVLTDSALRAAIPDASVLRERRWC
jgi:hypothetical protein